MAMELPAGFLSEDQLTCSICLEVFNNPVSTPCGHSFCQVCISSYWDGGAGRGGAASKYYQCPLCKESFHKRPDLHINCSLKEITERFKQMSTADVPTDGSVGGVEQPNAHHHHHHRPALNLSPRAGEMSETVIAEMTARFQQLPAFRTPHSSVLGPSDLQPQSVSRATAHLAVQVKNNEHHDPPPPYSPPHRSTVSSRSNSSSRLCPIHLNELEFFCRSDNICVCSSCVETSEHRGHNVTPAKREWHIKKSQLGIAEVELKDLICERERKVEEIQSSIQEIKAAAEREADEAVDAFSKLISSVECCQAGILKVIEKTLRAAEHKAQSLLRELEQEIAELKKRSTTLSQLTVSEDYILFLKEFPALSTPPQAKDWSSASVSSQLTSGVILKAVNEMLESFQEQLQKLPEICDMNMVIGMQTGAANQESPEEMHVQVRGIQMQLLSSSIKSRHGTQLDARPLNNLSKQFSLVQSVPRSNPKVKLVQTYADNITLDPSTAHPRLVISGDGKQVHCGDRHQSVPDNPERFDRVVCVLANQGFSSGRHYWEVEVGGKTDWDLGVASRSVNRKGKITVSPANGYWFLSLRDRTDYAFRTEPSTILTVNPRPSRIGIYVDCDKGLVSFYNVEARTLIYTFTDGFSGTIHPFFSPCTNKSGQNAAPLTICPVAMTE